MFPMQEIRGKENKLAARLCLLGWTAIRRIGRSPKSKEAQTANTAYLHTFRSQIMTPDIVPVLESEEDFNFSLKRFWDLETVGIVALNQEQIGRTPDENVAWKKAEQSLAVAVPWKNERPNLPNNRQVAERRLQLVEKKLMKDEQLATAYQGVIDEYLKKGYITQVVTSEPEPEGEWFYHIFQLYVLTEQQQKCESFSMRRRSLTRRV